MQPRLTYIVEMMKKTRWDQDIDGITWWLR